MEMALGLIEPVETGRWSGGDKVSRKKADALMELLEIIVRSDARAAEPLYQSALRDLGRAEELSVEDDPSVIVVILATLAHALHADASHEEAARLSKL